MTLTATLIALGLALSVAAFCGWRGAAPPDLVRSRPRMVPWRFLMVMAAAVAMLLLTHLAALLGGPAAP